jgi:hypothetical protein
MLQYARVSKSCFKYREVVHGIYFVKYLSIFLERSKYFIALLYDHCYILVR